MQEWAFREWLAARSWGLAVRYCRAVAWLLPPAALAANAPYFRGDGWLDDPGFLWLLAWQVTAEAVCITTVLANRWLPQLRGREWPLYLFCAVFMAMTTWIGLADGALRGDLSLYATGSTFIAAVICTPRPMRRPLYALSFAALCVAAWLSAHGSVATTVAMLVNPFCVVVLCMELDRLTLSRARALYAETRRAEAERERADSVLYDLLPVHVADQLKQDGRAPAIKYANMGVLFADIVGFTRYARRLPPDALVMMLNQVFSGFDGLVREHGVEKIKTLGDGYMAVAHEGAHSLCSLALAMHHAMTAYNQANGTDLHLRIGIHAGPAVAGVIGIQRPLYDVWGETVNVASRLESAAPSGATLVSAAVYAQAAASFAFEVVPCVPLRDCGSVKGWLLQANGAAAAPAPVAAPA
jgi:class 3 adenylate cyclase